MKSEGRSTRVESRAPGINLRFQDCMKRVHVLYQHA